MPANSRYSAAHAIMLARLKGYLMANRNYNRLQALEKEVKLIYAEISIDLPSPSSGPLAPNFGPALSNFAVLAASTVTNTGASIITGDLGLSPGTSVTGFPPGIVNGTQHVADQAAADAQVALTAAYTDLAGRSVTTNYSGTDLGTLTLTPGVYKFNTSAQLTGTLTLNAAGDANAVWIFQIGSTLTTAAASAVSIINGGSASNVYWQVGSSATIGTTTDMKGHILAQASITFNTGATLDGSALARTAAVTLDANVITLANIAAEYSLVGSYGVASVERNSAGNFTIVLEDKYMRLLGCSVMQIVEDAQDRIFQIASEDVDGDKSIIFRSLAGSAEADPAVGSRLLISFELQNSSVYRR